jgi:putative ABC transport system ATP-binding protein
MDGGAANGALIVAQGVGRVFRTGAEEVRAVDGVSLEVASGELLAIVGRSGSGKTTLLNLLAGLDRPTSGTVRFEGRDLADFSERELVDLRRHRQGFVFQSFGLLPLLSAHENVDLPLRIGGVGGRERRERVDKMLERVGLARRSAHRPFELSGGEQQRVAIVRALVTRPQVIFADEPTGELDVATGLSVASLLRDLVRESGVTVVTATHDLTLAGMADRVVELEDGAIRG